MLFRTWFYVLAAVPVIVASPVLVLSLLHKRTYPIFYWMARNLWATPILYGMGCPPRIENADYLDREGPFMLVANHTSMLDVMLMLRVSRRPFAFVGKAELARIPLFGYFYRQSSILVDRENFRSRIAVYDKVGERLHDVGGICIFPEGGVPDETVVLDEFRPGAFKLAIRHGLTVIPMTFLDCKRRFSWTFFSGGPGPLRVRVHPPIKTNGLEPIRMAELRDGVRAQMLQDLLDDQRALEAHPDPAV